MNIESWGCVCVLVAQSSPTLQPHGLQSPWNSPGQNTVSGWPFPPPGDLPNPGIEPGSPALQADFLSAEPPGKPRKGRDMYSLGA